MNPDRNCDNNNDDCCPICLESLIGGSKCNIGDITATTTTDVDASSVSYLGTHIGMNAPCGHCLHISCYKELNATNNSRTRKTKCPTCNTPTQYFVHLDLGTLDSKDTAAALQRPNGPVDSVVVESPSSSSSPPLPESPQPCTVVCTPCGHVFHGHHHEWQQWMENTIQRKEEEQRSFCYSNTHSHLHRRLGVCPLCNISVAYVMRLYTNLPTHHPISMLNEMTRTTNVTGTIPNRVVVTGAGSTEVNGVYTWDGRLDQNTNRYVRYGTWKNALGIFNIICRYIPTGEKYWLIAVVTDLYMEDQDIVFYRAPLIPSCPAVPPPDGWSMHHCTKMQSRAPCPQLTYQYYDPVSGSIHDILELPQLTIGSSGTECVGHPPGRMSGVAHIDASSLLSELTVPTFVMTESESIEGPAIVMPEPEPIVETPVVTVQRSPTYVIVEGAGHPAVNGTYVQDLFSPNTVRYIRDGSWENSPHRFYIFLRHMSDSNTWHWCISLAPIGDQPGTNADINFYMAVPMTEASFSKPPTVGWFKTGEGIDPLPHLLYRDHVEDRATRRRRRRR